MNIDATDIGRVNARLNTDKYPWVNLTLLESALSSYMYYDTPLEQACSIFRGIIKNHPFSNANKRTAAITLYSILDEYCIPLPKEDDMIELAVDVAEHQYSVE